METGYCVVFPAIARQCSREPPNLFQVSRASAAFQFTFRKNAAM